MINIFFYVAGGNRNTKVGKFRRGISQIHNFQRLKEENTHTHTLGFGFRFENQIFTTISLIAPSFPRLHLTAVGHQIYKAANFKGIHVIEENCLVLYIFVILVMMLVRSSLPSSIDNHGKQESSCVWIPGDGSWQEPTNVVPVIKHKKKNDSLWSRNVLSSSQLSTEVNMFETSKPNFVYRRRAIQRNVKANVCDVLPRNPCSTPTLVYKRRKVVSDNLKSGSVGDELIEDPKSKKKIYSGLHAVNDSCSSSKSNIDLGSVFVKHQVDDVGECSSSGVVIMEVSNSCFPFLKQHGVLERLKTTKKQTSLKNNICCLKACKVCDRSTSTSNMLICDLCEESFHVFCCNPGIKKVPVGDWFCHFCSRKQLKKIKETNSRKFPKDCLGPIASMLRDIDPYTSNVRIGKYFQAEVPVWSGPLTDELNDYIKLTEISPLDCASYQDWDSSKLSRLGSIGNWLQCREEVDDDGTVCGNWRRAPLFEVQTDNWECFRSVLWDPSHADCAVPQELDTDQVLKQLKYIEMLRPRLSAKRWKMGVNKRINQQEHTTDPRNTHKS